MKKAKKYERLNHFYPNLERKVRDILKSVRGSSSEIGGAEIDRIFDVLEDPEKSLAWVVGRCTEDELANWIVSILQTPFKDRKLLSSVDSPKLLYDYGVLTGVPYIGEQEYDPPGGKELLDKFDKIVEEKGYNRFLDDLYQKLLMFVRTSSCNDCDWLLSVSDRMGSQAYDVLLCEKKDAENLGLTSIHMHRVSQYIWDTWSLFHNVLLHLIFFSRLPPHEVKERLGIVLKQTLVTREKISDIVAEEDRTTSYQRINNPIGPVSSSPATQVKAEQLVFTSFLKEKALIDRCLEEELATHTLGHILPCTFSHQSYTDYKSGRAFLQELLGKDKIGSDDFKNFNLTVEFIAEFNKLDLSYVPANDSYIVWLFYYGFIKSKAHPPGCLFPRTIASKMINGEKITEYEKLFLAEKLDQMYFVVCNRKESYPIFNRISQTYLDILEALFLLPTDYLCYEYTSFLFIQMIGYLTYSFYVIN